VAERHIEARAGRGDLHVRGDHRLAPTDRGPHRLAQHRVDAGAAMLHLAVDADDCALAIGDGWSVEQLDELRMSLSPNIAPASNSGLRSSTNRPAKGLRITAIPTARTIGRGAATPSSERINSRIVMIFGFRPSLPPHSDHSAHSIAPRLPAATETGGSSGCSGSLF
jgi:hypothetical protein